MLNVLNIIQVPNQREQQSPCVQWELVPKIVIKYFSEKWVNIVDLLLRSSVRDETSLTLGQELNSLNLGGHVSQVLGRLLLAVPGKHIRTCLHQQQNTLTISISEMSLFLKASKNCCTCLHSQICFPSSGGKIVKIYTLQPCGEELALLHPDSWHHLHEISESWTMLHYNPGWNIKISLTEQSQDSRWELLDAGKSNLDQRSCSHPLPCQSNIYKHSENEIVDEHDELTWQTLDHSWRQHSGDWSHSILLHWEHWRQLPSPPAAWRSPGDPWPERGVEQWRWRHRLHDLYQLQPLQNQLYLIFYLM